MSKYEYIIGEIYGVKQLVDLYCEYKNNKKINMAVLKCIYCGKIQNIRRDAIHNSKFTSCKCRTVKHGSIKKRLYGIWANMKYRCNTETAQGYFRYGGSGITVCDEWNEYVAFEKWAMSHGYNDTLTIDRIDEKKGYCPENCQWLTRSENTAKANKTSQHRMADKGMYFALDPDGNTYMFSNANQFAKEHNLLANCIRQCANNEKKSHHKWKFWHEERDASSIDYPKGVHDQCNSGMEAHDTAR